jgi:acyl-CoA synthetase (AMP-forming)/AMP-acid ligase II/NAD(P)-dependent dehydrogenase (short-subunit alcohol dehydrogenase family)
MAIHSPEHEHSLLEHAHLLAKHLAEHPDVADCFVMRRNCEAHGAQWVAYVVAAGPFAPDRWQTHLRAALPDGPVLDAFVHLAALPLTSSGAVDEDELLRLEVIDGDLTNRCEKALQEVANIQEVAVVAQDAASPTPPLHLANLIPGWTSRAPGQGAGEAAAEESASAPRSSAPSTAGNPSISIGPPLTAVLPPTLADALRRTVERFPEQWIICTQADGPPVVCTYRHLQKEAECILGGLRKLGLQAGDKALFQFENNQDFIAAFWGCVLGGIVPVPISIAPTYQESNATTAKLHNAWEMLGHPIVLTDRRLAPAVASLPRLFAMDGLRIAVIEDLRNNAPDHTWHACQPDDLTILLLTSGSTGRPKAVAQSHRSILSRCAATAQMNDFSAADVSLNWLPLDHVGGIVMFHVRDVFLGCKQVHAPTQAILRAPLLWLDLIDRQRATITWAPNFAYALVNARADEVAERHWDLSSMRFILNAGEAIVARTARRFLEVLSPHGLPPTAMRPAWGMSETSSAVTFSHRFTRETTSDQDPFVEVGGPIPGFAMRIVDVQGRVVEEGKFGSLQVRGPSVTSGYYQEPGLNADAFVDGWFITGDLGVLRDGQLTITGRQKDVIIINGVNFYSHEIESVVEEVPGVEVSFTAACAVREAGRDTDSLAVFFHTAVAGGEALALLLKEVRGRVVRMLGVSPNFLLPVPKEAIPKTEIGKIQRAQLRKRFESGEFEELLQQVDILTGSPNTLPDWFLRKAWRRKELSGGPKSHGNCLLFVSPGELGDAVRSRLEQSGWTCILVVPGLALAQVGPRHFRLSPTSLDDYPRLLETLASMGISRILDLWALEGPDSVLGLARALGGAREEGGRARLVVVSRGALPATPADVPATRTAILPGLLQGLAQELPFLDCRLVDLDDGTIDSHAAALERELEQWGDREVAYRGGERLVPRLERVDFRRPKQPVPVQRGGLYLVTGGLGGIGAEIAKYLLKEHACRLLLIGRQPLSDRPEVQTAARLEVLRALAGLGEVRYEAVDVGDEAGLQRAVAEAEAAWGQQLVGVFHLAGTYRDRPLAEETSDSLSAALHAKITGTAVLHRLVEDRPGSLFVSFSSVLGFFGGAMVGAYAAANRGLEGLAHAQRHRSGVRGYCYAWGGWRDIGMSRGPTGAAALRAKGIQDMTAEQGVHSLIAALAQDEPFLLIGLDGSNPHVRKHLEGGDCRGQQLVAYYTATDATVPRPAPLQDRFGTVSSCELVRLEELPRTADGAIDRQRLAVTGRRRRRGVPEYVAPRTEGEQRIATIWQEVLGEPRIGVQDNFFEFGGHSLLAVKVLTRLRDGFGIELSLPILFEAPTVAALAERLQQHGSETASPPPLAPISRDGPLPLSFAQQRLWFFHALDPASPVYSIPAAVRLRGPLNVAALQQGLEALVSRHESLRTTFPAVAGRPTQVICQPAAAPLAVTDLGHLPPAAREAEALRLATEEVRRPFDLSRGPLLRLHLLRIDPEDHVLVLTMHHIASDGWSLEILFRELDALYGAFSAGAAPDLPPLPIQYADYAVWQRQWLQGDVLERELAYWKQQLAGPPANLDLPADHPRPAVQSFRGAVHRVLLPATVADGALAFCRREEATLFMTLLAAFQGLLYAWTGQEDICVGSPIAGRPRIETEGLIGLFANTLVLRTQLHGGPTFRELLGRTRETALGAYAHPEVPFEKLVDALRPPRDLSRNPLFQVNFRAQMAPPARLQLSRLACSLIDLDPGIARFDFALDLWRAPEGLAGYVEYSTDLFDKATVVWMVEDFERLLVALVAHPDVPLHELDAFAEIRKRPVAHRPRGTPEGTRAAGRERSFAAVQRKAVPLIPTASQKSRPLTPNQGSADL